MASSLLAPAATGAGLELLFGIFLKAVLQAKRDCAMFRSVLENMENTLNSLNPVVRRIDSFNRDFDRPHEIEGLKVLMKKGANLVHKCSKLRRLEFFRKPYYTRKLLKLEESLRRYINIDLAVNHFADSKETLFEVKQTTTQISKLSNQISQLSMGSAFIGSFNKGGFGLTGRCSPPELKVDPIGLEIPLKELKKRLLEEEDTHLVVVSAPGGCGKTTLITALCQDVEVLGEFKNNIFFVNVSKSPNLMVIVQRLFHHNGWPSLDFQSEEDAVNQLECLLKGIGPDPILLVLDDVWSGSEHLLEKLKFRIKNYKILVTSRYEFPTFGSTYKLGTLNDADAMTLFRQSAIPRDGEFYVPDDDKLNELVKSFKGFPLAISVVGKSLCRKPAAEWRKRLKECSKAASILSKFENEIVNNCLQSSVDSLDNKPVVKECFMDLGSFPEDHKIPATALIDMWVELHKLDEDEAIINLHELSNLTLADLEATRKIASEDDGNYNEHFVTQHDLLRELAIRQSSSGSIEYRKRLFVDRENITEWRKEQKQLFIHANLLSICTDELLSSSWCNVQAPEVEVLVLNFRVKNYAFPELMERMEKLKVLIVINHGFFPAELSNFVLLGSLSNVKRIRLEKVSIPTTFFHSIQRKLEKLSLVMCNIGDAFSNLMDDFSDVLPNLVEINIDYCSDLEELPIGFCGLVLLKKLSITNCHKLSSLPDEIGELENLEVLRLNSCIDLEELPETIGNLHKLCILDLSDCFSIQKLPEQIGNLYHLSKLYMIDCSSCELPPSVTNLDSLKEVIGDEETANSWKIFKNHLPKLKINVHKDISLNWLL